MNRSGNWAFMRRMTLVRPDGMTYLDRLRIIQTPWFAIYLHRIDAPDPGIDLHDHPWPFWSFILRGGYDEWRAKARTFDSPIGVQRRLSTEVRNRFHFAPSINRMGLGEAHTIRHVYRVPTWTLMFVGRRSREWGFYADNRWYDHTSYEALGRRELSRRTKG